MPHTTIASGGTGSMSLDSWIAGGVVIAILVYLVYTLLRPERF